MDNNLELIKMERYHISEAVDFIGKNMDSNEQQYASRTMNFHFDCEDNKLDDGRSYYIWKNDQQICGLAGLHNYTWGPKENVWLGWFAVGKEFRRKGYGRQLIKRIESIGYSTGYRKFFVETYSSPHFAEANLFYVKTGFTLVSRIPCYMNDGADMLIYYKPVQCTSLNV